MPQSSQENLLRFQRLSIATQLLAAMLAGGVLNSARGPISDYAKELARTALACADALLDEVAKKPS